MMPILEIDSLLREAEESWNVMDISNIIVRILRARPDLNMADIERRFRELGCKQTYLLAWPKENIPGGYCPVSLDGGDAEYGLWVCVNGHHDMLTQLFEFGMTKEDNMLALTRTGIGIRHG